MFPIFEGAVTSVVCLINEISSEFLVTIELYKDQS